MFVIRGLLELPMLNNAFSGGRSSNIELLRLVAQYIIVYYHLLLLCVVPFCDNPMFKALLIPAHIGVIVFVLISGYFGIRPTSKGLLKLLFALLVFSMPEIYFKIKDAASPEAVVKSLFFFSHTHFWFIRTYVCLYLVSPMVNAFIEKSTAVQRIYIMSSLFFISIYLGTVGGDPSLGDGKNLANFIFLYLVGHALRLNSQYLEGIKMKAFLVLYLALNLILVFGYYMSYNHVVGKILWTLSFPYSSPILLLNSVLFFVMFSKLSFQSKVVNYLASSSLAIYLIHGNRPLCFDIGEKYGRLCSGGIIGNAVEIIRSMVHNGFLFAISLLVLTILIILFCIMIDKMLSPLWNLANSKFNQLYYKIGF